MFYDLEDPGEFVEGIASCLAEDGVWVIELSLHANDAREEQLRHHRPRAPRVLQPGRARVAARRGRPRGARRRAQRHQRRLDPPLRRPPRQAPAHAGGLRRPAGPARQGVRARARRRRALRALRAARPSACATSCAPLLERLRDEGKKVHVYGASTKGNTILQYIDASTELIEYAADRNPEKWGSETIGTGIPIISEEESRAMKPDYYLALPWHFLDEFLEREKEFLDRGGKFIVPLPEVREVDGSGAGRAGRRRPSPRADGDRDAQRSGARLAAPVAPQLPAVRGVAAAPAPTPRCRPARRRSRARWCRWTHGATTSSAAWPTSPSRATASTSRAPSCSPACSNTRAGRLDGGRPLRARDRAVDRRGPRPRMRVEDATQLSFRRRELRRLPVPVGHRARAGRRRRDRDGRDVARAAPRWSAAPHHRRGARARATSSSATRSTAQASQRVDGGPRLLRAPLRPGRGSSGACSACRGRSSTASSPASATSAGSGASTPPPRGPTCSAACCHSPARATSTSARDLPDLADRPHAVVYMRLRKPAAA